PVRAAGPRARPHRARSAAHLRLGRRLMPIEGPRRELGIHDVFQLLDLSRKTGVLRVTSELRHNAGTVSFEGGTIIFAEIRSNPHPLGALLLRTGKITDADLERARDMQQRHGDKRRLGEILVSLGAITPRELERQVRFQIEEVVFEMMSWREGYFSFTEGPLDAAPTSRWRRRCSDSRAPASSCWPTPARPSASAPRSPPIWPSWWRAPKTPWRGATWRRRVAWPSRPRACIRTIPPCTCCSVASRS